eukprot:scaffold14091_cov121-Isochrysis_galbana.AAC.7
MSAIARLADRIWSTTAAERRVRADTRTSPPKRGHIDESTAGLDAADRRQKVARRDAPALA